MKKPTDEISRRKFIAAGLTGAVLAASPLGAAAQQNDAGAATAKPPLPRRPLGKSGVDAPMMSLGGSFNAHSPEYLDQAWALGIRYFDSARSYMGGKCERNIGAWLAKYPERRKELFLVGKDGPKSPEQLKTMVDGRLKSMETGYIDLMFIHGIGPGEYGEESLNWPKSAEWKQAVADLKAAGKIKLFGFSCHDNRKADYLMAAAEGGFIDAIMVAYSPVLPKNPGLEAALDACHKAGIGLICMKSLNSVRNLPKQLPELEPLGLTTHQAILQGVWGDGRFSAVCSEMDNLQALMDNIKAAHGYEKPLAPEIFESMRKTAMACVPNMCPSCDGSCAQAAGRAVALSDIARFVTYYEHGGKTEAREYYRALAQEQRAWAGADLAAAREACYCKVDFESVMAKAERYFG